MSLEPSSEPSRADSKFKEERERKEAVEALRLDTHPSRFGGAVYKHAVMASATSFFIFIVYGASLGTLGAVLPYLYDVIDASESQLAFFFTSRGIGYLVGTILSGVLLEGFYGIDYTPSLWWTENKLLLFTFSGVICGLFTVLVITTNNYAAIVVIFFIQGMGFGGADTVGNCLLPELWTEELGPWMQALHCSFGVGAVIGPALVGSIGYINCFIILGVGSLVPVGLYPYVMHLRIRAEAEVREATAARKDGKGDEKIEEEKGGVGDGVKLETGSVVVFEEGDEAAAAAVGGDEKAGAQQSTPLPRSIQALVVLFFVVYVGSESGYGGWVSTYVLDKAVVATKQEAAFVASWYWGGLTAGRLIAIPLAVKLSTTTHLRTQLAGTVVGAILTLTVLDTSYISACVVSAIYSLALSAIFPLALSIVKDYGFEVDASATASFICASCMGDAVVPVIIGLCIASFGADALTVSVTVFAGLLVTVYTAIAVASTQATGKYAEVEKSEGEK
jgi:fucose permease